MRRLVPICLFLIVVAVVPALRATDAGRVSLHICPGGYLGPERGKMPDIGLRWPDPGATEFLGSGGLLVRFASGEEGEPIYLGPGSFESILPGGSVAVLHEGCRNGIRYPAYGCDDDGDGVSDEDPLDGVDNDGDGSVDEDFAAIGHDMLVSKAISSRTGIIVTQSCFRWSYGHVRDFAGFRTEIAYRGRKGKKSPALKDVEAVLFVDFDVGDGEKEDRGRNDIFYFLRTDEGEGAQEAVAATDPGQAGPIAALAVFSVTGPGGESLGVETSISPAGTEIDSLWSAQPAEAGDDGTMTGDMIAFSRIGTAGELEHKESIVIEWAVVFGRNEQHLIKNLSRARETWQGMETGGGVSSRWFVPARKAARIRLDASPASVWINGSRQPALYVGLPPENVEEVEWLKVAGEIVETFEQIDDRIITAVGAELIGGDQRIGIEGQLTDGTIFTAGIDPGDIRKLMGEDRTEIGRLPDECLRLYPNPFVTGLNINVNISQLKEPRMQQAEANSSRAGSVRVYDVKGRLVRTILTEETLHPGDYSMSWDGMDENGTQVAPGVYYCKLQIGERSLTKRVILLR
jgi:hypothetical protein